MTILEESDLQNKNKSSGERESSPNTATPSPKDPKDHKTPNVGSRSSSTDSPGPGSSRPHPGLFERSQGVQGIASMISGSVGDRYITPEYLAPLPSTEKTGKSPLQLLAQTCSQIGADNSSNKLLAEKINGSSTKDPRSASDSGSPSKNSNNNSLKRKHDGSSPTLIVSDQSQRTTSPRISGVNFKPYETDTKSKAGSVVSISPSTSPKSNGQPAKRSKSPRVSPQTISSSKPSEATSPVIRSGLEVLAGHPKDVPLGSYRFPGALDAQNPAFRPPFGMPGFPPSSIAASLAAAAASAAAGGISVCRDPYCRDPTCPTAVYNAQLASITCGLPPGYAELVKAHQVASAMAAASNSSAATTSTSSSSSSVSSSREAPYICNWMNGREGYCGKRHSSAEELLQHLRTHTNLSTNDSAAAAAMLSPSLYPQGGLLGGSTGGSAAAAAAAAIGRSYGGAFAAASSRYHPYAKPGAGLGAGHLGLLSSNLPGLPGLGSPPGLSGLNGASALAGLAAGAYNPSSLYALYGSRLAGAGSSSPLP